MDNSNTNYFVGKYNYSRRVVDHRVQYDLNYSINHSVLSKRHLSAFKNQMIGSLVQNFGLYYSMGACVLALALVTADATYRYYNYPAHAQAKAFNTFQSVGQKFVNNYNNAKTDLGQWNHNFNCFENEPNCGRDYDWVKK